jgi:hypothetical protein
MLDLNLVINKGKECALEKGRATFPQHTHRISSVGHPCERFLYHSIHDWDKVNPTPLPLQAIFKLGKRIEAPLIAWFNEEVGPLCSPRLRLIELQMAVVDKVMREYNISGTPDAVLVEVDDDGSIVRHFGIVDLKSCSAGMFNQYCDEDSLKRHTWSFLYIAQSMLYSFAFNYPNAYLFFVSKQNVFYDWKLMELPLDYGYIEEVLQKCARVNECLKKETVPQKLNQPFWCKDCRFEPICLPELECEGTETILNEDSSLESLINRVRELAPVAKEYKQSYDELKGKLVKGKRIMFEDCMVDWTQYEVKEKKIPASTKPAYMVSKMKILPYDDSGE